MSDSERGRFYACDAKGNVRTLYYGHNSVCSSLLQMERMESGGRTVSIGLVELTPRARRDGWSSMRDLYEAEDRLEDWDQFLKYHIEARDSIEAGVEQLEDKYLPDEVFVRRKKKQQAVKIDLLPPKRERMLEAIAGSIDTKKSKKEEKDQ